MDDPRDHEVMEREGEPPAPGAPLLDYLLGDWEAHDGRHLCPLCGNPIPDPLEECPTCAARFDGEEGQP